MKISTTMLKQHLGQITLTYFVDHNEMPEDLSEFDSYIETMRFDAQARGDLPWLFIGLKHLTNNHEIDLASYGGGVFPLKDEDMRDIINHVLNVLHAPGGISPPIIPITLESMTSEAWATYREETPLPARV